MSLIKPTLAYEHLQQMPDDGKRYELLGGELVVSPSPSWQHQQIAWKLVEFLNKAVRAGFGTAAFAPMDVVLDDHNVVQPDLLFISEGRPEINANGTVQGAPDLVIEILSESTRGRDLGAKLRIYARFGVRFYWAVDPEEEAVRIYELEGPGGYAEKETLRTGPLTCPLFPGIELSVNELFTQR